MRNEIKSMIEDVKKEIRDEAEILNSKGYKIRLRITNYKYGDKCLHLFVNGTYVSCFSGNCMYATFIDLKNGLKMLETFITDVA